MRVTTSTPAVYVELTNVLATPPNVTLQLKLVLTHNWGSAFDMNTWTGTVPISVTTRVVGETPRTSGANEDSNTKSKVVFQYLLSSSMVTVAPAGGTSSPGIRRMIVEIEQSSRVQVRAVSKFRDDIGASVVFHVGRFCSIRAVNSAAWAAGFKYLIVSVTSTAAPARAVSGNVPSSSGSVRSITVIVKDSELSMVAEVNQMLISCEVDVVLKMKRTSVDSNDVDKM
mmetsp:Transcript_55423/g.129704  ORF Transcript_55423/g.129704 Transcript_55423/m.129704 type:complete len:227 (-) Transcript_55423:1737-2417(-)